LSSTLLRIFIDLFNNCFPIYICPRSSVVLPGVRSWKHCIWDIYEVEQLFKRFIVSELEQDLFCP
jgi:hypothetical protein